MKCILSGVGIHQNLILDTNKNQEISLLPMVKIIEYNEIYVILVVLYQYQLVNESHLLSFSLPRDIGPEIC